VARTGTLVIADEIQCGSGRTGAFTHAPAAGLKPDLMALGKAMGAGMPIGAALFTNRVAAAAVPGDHGSTYGGNLLACRAALTFLDVIERDGVMANVARMSARLFDGLHAIASRTKVVKDVRGVGLIAGLDLAVDAAPVVTAAFERGLLVNRTSTTVVRLLPPYVITPADVDEALGILEEAVLTVA
jgi:acetylornithine/N-succinyldiaminopimelate aminotransferase